LGVTLPSFRDTPAPMLAVARAAEKAGVDGAFVFDHLFRRARDGALRPALEPLTMLGALAVETERIVLGTLVLRATLRPPVVLATALDTVARIAGAERVLVTIGAGDGESRDENERFGIPFGTLEDRVGALRSSVEACRDRGYPVWVGGIHRSVQAVARECADGWNRWGGTVAQLAVDAAPLRAAAARVPFGISWAGLVVVGDTEAAAQAKAERLAPAPGTIVGGPERVAEALRAYGDAGADWVIAGPVDSSDPEVALILGERVRPLLV
jgi:alkanesulfonate monooxygenase SsuD/methylene tetrahydromethanopterin reductase-like flavin-dependent oxidoreductase (luciferase family)